MQITANIILVITTSVSLIVSFFVIYEFVMSTRIKRAKKASFPFTLRRPISYSQFHSALETVQAVLDEMRFVPDVVLGIHYQGLAYAAPLAKIMYKPVKHAIVHYSHQSTGHVFDSLSFDFDPEAVLKDRRVLILDNSMETGATMKAVRDEVAKYTSQILTIVVYDKDSDHEALIRPDLVLFSSVSPKQFLK